MLEMDVTKRQFNVLGPGAPIIASVGEEAVLSCHLSPETDAEDMEVTWHRMDPPALVHHYAASQDQLWQQNLQYRGRTEFLKENINTGQVALRIFPTVPSDGGEYRCNFASSTFESEAQVEVLVTATTQASKGHRMVRTFPECRMLILESLAERDGGYLASGTAPQIHIEPGGTGEVQLTCTSRGWYPEPEVQWRDLQGLRYLVPASETKTVAEDGLFHVQTSVTVDASSRNLSCAIRNPVLGEKKETHISMADWDLYYRAESFQNPSNIRRGMSGNLCLSCSIKRASMVHYQENMVHCKENMVHCKENMCRTPFRNSCQAGLVVVNSSGFCSLQIEHGSLQREHAQSKALGAEGLSVIKRFAANITLDQDTAHPNLKVSEDRKHVRPVSEKQDVPDNPERFDTLRSVLGENSFSAGDHYWEVDVAWNSRWAIGLCVESVKRKGGITVCPENGFWALSLKFNVFMALTTPPSILKISKDIQIVGIFLQYEKGLISFYNVTEYSLLYTFKSTFTKPLKPYFYTDYYIWGINSGLYLPSCQ
ncbi:butyrophilin subfamily 1 member A1-like [Erinaceus europaeus]|uniref:Butyrophilin subfamily 1 member A1-like n=1 Tax=Erinaceus europaeus TaxID=9365 RepID=A0ABM3XW64_ERIEU|nr:butyrophilin subfamily 1 member A1-like [Erinaceus europaeus]